MSSTTPGAIATDLGVAAPAVGSTQEAQWLLWISEAEMLINARLGNLAALDQTRLEYVVRKAVKEAVKHPDDATQVEIQVDDGRVAKRYQSAKGRVDILPEWWALLDPDLGDAGAFSVQPYGEPDTAADCMWAGFGLG